MRKSILQWSLHKCSSQMQMISSRFFVLRGILREFRLLSPTQEPVVSTMGVQFLLSEYRRFSHSGKLAEHKVLCDAMYYWCLLNSQRKKKDLLLMYKGAGERPVEEVAKLMGFKLPKQYE